MSYRIVELASMADPPAEAFGGEDRASEIPHRRMNGFTPEALRGFGTFKVAFDAGVGGDQIAETLMRIAIPQRRDMYRFGFRFSLRGTCARQSRLVISGRSPMRRERMKQCF